MRTSPDEYPPGSWDYHWDFNNLAFVETFGLLKAHLDSDTCQLWQHHLLQWKTNTHGAVNWLAMRALALFRRGQLLNRSQDIRKARKYLNQVLTAQTRDGCFDDLPGISRPSQYHAYTTCLLLRMKALSPRPITRACIKAFQWMLGVCAPDGDTTALGRGQGQIFGAACAVYLFRKARLLDPHRAGAHLWAETRNLDRLKSGMTPQGYLPLVLNDRPVEERCGWYDYHHLTVYNAFALVWLSLARTEIHIPPSPGAPAPLPPAAGNTWLKASGVVSLDRTGVALVCTAGESGAGYAADVGITPHYLFWKGHPLFRYPMGPGPGKYGTKTKEDRQAENIWAPLVHDGHQWIAPFGGKGHITSLGKGYCITYHVHGIIWQREIHLHNQTLTVSDTLDLSRATRPIRQIRMVNIALKRGWSPTGTEPGFF